MTTDVADLCVRLRSEVNGCLAPDTMELLYAEVRDQPEGGDVVEIGTLWGRTAILMAQAILDRGTAGMERLWCIDPCGNRSFKTEHDEIVAKIRATWGQWGVDKVATLVPIPSQEARHIGVGSTIRMVFVDGDHHGETPKEDILWAIDRLDGGGIIVVDDSDWTEVADGVRAGLDTGRMTLKWFHQGSENGVATSCYKVSPKEPA